MKVFLFLILVVTFLIRVPFVIFGVVMVLDGSMPVITEQLKVDKHPGTAAISSGNISDAGAQYTLNFSGVKSRSCSVDDFVYDTLHDGDNVTVSSSRLMHYCVEIRRGDIIVKPIFPLWKWCDIVCGLFCIIAALFGKIAIGNDNDPSVGIHVEI